MGKALMAIDIFSGVGGMSVGAEMAGIKVNIAIENNSFAADTFKLNHKDTTVLVDDIRNIKELDTFPKNPFILFGGPPCQGFSLSNTKSRNHGNPNNSLFQEFLRFVDNLRPEWVVFENVEGIVSFEKGKVVKILKDTLTEFGYIFPEPKVLIASDYGVPQNRNRFFLIANRINVNYQFPKKDNKKISVQEALYDLPDLQNGDSFYELPYKSNELNRFTNLMRASSQKATQNFVSKNKDYILERYKYIKPGQNWRAIPSNLMENYAKLENTHSGIYKRLDPAFPSVVISNYRKNMLIHPFQDRGLSVREAARLQSFPDNFIFKGSLMHIQQQIGNAVPPILAYRIFQSIIDQTFNGNRKRKQSQSAILEV